MCLLPIFINLPLILVYFQWETLLKEIIDQCHQDNVGDQWIVVISEIMKTFPDRSLFNVDLSDQECEGFDQSIQELRKTGRCSMTSSASIHSKLKLIQ